MDSPRPSLARLVALRFLCAYVVLQIVPFPIGALPGTQPLLERYHQLLGAVLPWVGTRILGFAEVATAPTGSEASPMGLLWRFMGYSRPYTVFTGVAEAAAGFLLFFRRTTTLGALLSAAVMANVAMLNLAYDVPVKLFSLQLFLAALLLLAPDLRRLASTLVWNRPTPAADLTIPAFPPRLRRARIPAKLLLVAAIVGATAHQGHEGYTKWGDGAPRHPPTSSRSLAPTPITSSSKAPSAPTTSRPASASSTSRTSSSPAAASTG